jgi:hypothetical protein
MASRKDKSLESEDIKQLLSNSEEECSASSDESDVAECLSGNEDENNELGESESEVEVAIHTKCQWTNNEKTSVIFPFISYSGGVCKDLVSKYDAS